MASISSSDSSTGASIGKMGEDIMIAGLAFQVATLLVFIIVCLDFALTTLRRHKVLGDAALDQNPTLVKVRGSLLFRGFLVALALATVCIFWRSVFRVAELSQGWSGPLMKRQDLFIGFEGVMIVVACLALNAFNPAFCFKELLEGKGGLGSRRKEKKAFSDSEAEMGKSGLQSGAQSA
jgi:hypothetical protein